MTDRRPAEEEATGSDTSTTPEGRDRRHRHENRQTPHPPPDAATLTAGLDALRNRATTNADTVAYLRGHGALDAPTLDRLLCDSLVAIVTHHGTDVHATAPVRLATPAQRQTLHAMHPTCQFPGCGRTHYLQAHHLIRYHPIHGPTALWNLALLCDEHHDHLHRPQWTAALTNDHTLLVWHPDGTLLTRGALRPPTPSAAAAAGADQAESAKTGTSPDARARHLPRSSSPPSEQSESTHDANRAADPVGAASARTGDETEATVDPETATTDGPSHVMPEIDVPRANCGDGDAPARSEAPSEAGSDADRTRHDDPGDFDDPGDAQSATTEPGAPPPVDVSRRLHGCGERMDAWALDNYLHAWLEASAA